MPSAPSAPPGQSKIVQIPPITVMVDDCLAHILEVAQLDFPWGTEYAVSVMVECKGIRSRVFNLSVRNEKELKAKLIAEVTKFKLMRLVLGDETTRDVVGGVPLVR